MSQIVTGNFNEELSSRYLTYALSTIMSRALPDVRDGLKPVHRRLLYAMYVLKLDPQRGYKKCARVVGDVIGKYHPHGDSAVYDAMVRLAQDFAVRYPLVDGQGNFGNIDGDSAAAMRYTEARLTEVAKWLLKDLESGTVDFIPTYDDSDEEPVVLPACFPNLLANGSSGIAVGLSTNIPPHNVKELCNSLIKLLENPELTSEQLIGTVKGPDFPTGGVLLADRAALKEAYASGRGAFTIRAKWEKEELTRGLYQIIVTELPYQVQKSKLVAKIAELLHAKKLPWLADVRDESTEDIRLVFEPLNRNIDAEGLMASLFKLTELESRFNLNMNVITKDNVPQLMNLQETLQAFLDHRREVLVRKSNWRLAKIADRLHILIAYAVVYLNIDEVVEIIKTNDEPAPVLMQRFELDEVQANAILNMRLRSLRKLEEMEIKREREELEAEQKALQAIVGSAQKQTDVLIGQINAIREQFGDKRRTRIEAPDEDAPQALTEQVIKEPLTVILSQQGWVRTVKEHLADDAELKFKTGDEESLRFTCYTTDTLTIFSSNGKVYQIPAHKLPGGRGFGEPLNLFVEISSEEQVVEIAALQHEEYLLASQAGLGFRVKAEDLSSQTRTGKQVMNVASNDALAFVRPVVGEMVACVGPLGPLLIYTVEEINQLARGKGVKLMQLKGQALTDVVTFPLSHGLGLRSQGGRERVITPGIWLGKRAQVGKNLPNGFKQGATLFTPSEALPAEKIAEENSSRIEELIAGWGKDQEADEDLTEDQLDLLLGKEED